MKSPVRRPLLAAVTAAAAAAATALAVPAAPASAAPSELSSTAALRKAVTLQGVVEHLGALQGVADRNGGNRAAGFPGYQGSVDYVVAQLRAAGYKPVIDEFAFDFFAANAPAQLSVVGGRTIPTDYFTYSGTGTVTGTVVPVDVNLAGDRANTSGCEAADFGGFPSGSVALVQRGTCTFGEKVANAQAAGATAVVLFNQGNTEARSGLLTGTLGAADFTIPVVGASFAEGARLAQDRSTVRVVASTTSEERVTRNVLADLVPRTAGGQNGDKGRGSDVVLVGAHLDSVAAGAGINDNGTGSATILEIAEQMAAMERKGAGIKSTVRFAWWGAEELGLLGSEAYVAELQEQRPQELKRIKLNLNFDMVGSPNFARFVYDGDGNAELEGSADAPAGSAEIERVFVDYFKAVGLASAPTAFSGRSDYGPFIAEGVDIPAGGLFTGAEGTKTPAEVQLFGGKAGVAYDPCYHQVCDNLRGDGRTQEQQTALAGISGLRGNVNLTGLDQMSDAAAHATYVFALRNLRAGLKDPSGPVGTGSGDLSGGGDELHDHDHGGVER